MVYIGWDDVPAPTLNTVDQDQNEAQRLFEKAVQNTEIMLSNHRVHGDFSAYNILYHEGEIFMIDFPQAIDTRVNRAAFPIFRRDLTRLCEYFQAQGSNCDLAQLAEQLWEKHGYVLNTSDNASLIETEFENEL